MSVYYDLYPMSDAKQAREGLEDIQTEDFIKMIAFILRISPTINRVFAIKDKFSCA